MERSLSRWLIITLLTLSALSFSLFQIFHSLTTADLDFQTAFVAFTVVSLFLILGYMLGIITLTFAMLPILLHMWMTPEKKDSK